MLPATGGFVDITADNFCTRLKTFLFTESYPESYHIVWLGGVVVRALDLRLAIAGLIPAAALLSATLDKLFTLCPAPLKLRPYGAI